MKVELQRITASGQRTVMLNAAEAASKPETIRQWIKMLQLAERWLREGQKK